MCCFSIGQIIAQEGSFMEFYVIIPARYASTRLPGKPLQDIGGRPMLAHVYERACLSGATRVMIATDDERIVAAMKTFGAETWLTSAAHRSGTDRLAEVVTRAILPGDAIIVNLQGDEPLMPPALVRQVAQALHENPNAQVATLCEALYRMEMLFNPNIVKVVRNAQNHALYFSRAAIPWIRDGFTLELPQPAFRHIGLYAYRAAYLQSFTQLPPAPMENLEALEQLRALYYGGVIYVAEACETPGPGVDTPEDLAEVRRCVAAKNDSDSFVIDRAS
jgi:3-deoxy-manno-octulosonate cytidylyltransferase (CMP-KDO synthetase)